MLGASTPAYRDHDERRTQDQLGLGGIRNSFADLFFPGTSTIQTRLRYFLFVPWIYRSLEEEEVPAHRFGAAARERDLALIEPLLSSGDDGVFGRMAGEGVEDGGTLTWHRELPPAPVSFPDEVTLDLTYAEAEFLRDRIAAAHRGTLLAWLAFHPAELLDRDALGGWSVGECLDVARSQGGHTITPHAERFVRRWVELTLADAEGLPYSEDARSLVRRREMLLKGARSLFRNRRAREERYQGELGVGQLEFRWADVCRLLQDLYAGLARR